MQQITVNNNEKKGKLAQKSCFIFYFLWLSLLIASFSFAQTHIVHVHGNVTESTGRPLPGANITFFYPDSRDSVSTLTDSTGSYSVQLRLYYTGIENGESSIPCTFQLYQNYPNPFTSSTLIPFSISGPAHVIIRIFNIHGQLIRILADDVFHKGISTIEWNGLNKQGEMATPGIYFYQLEANGYVRTRKMIYLKKPGIISNTMNKLSARLMQISSEIKQWHMKIHAQKDGYYPYVEQNFVVRPEDIALEKDITLKRIFYLPLEVGNTWTYEYYLLVNPEQKDTITYSITDKLTIGEYDYYLFDQWPILLPYGDTNPALYRNNEKGDLVAQINNQDLIVYQFSDTTMNTTRIAHLDSTKDYPSGLNFITTLWDINDTVITNEETFEACYAFGSFIGPVRDIGLFVWFSPGIGAVRILTINVEVEYLLIDYHIQK